MLTVVELSDGYILSVEEGGLSRQFCLDCPPGLAVVVDVRGPHSRAERSGDYRLIIQRGSIRVTQSGSTVGALSADYPVR